MGTGLHPTKRRILEFVARRQRAPLSPPPSVAEVARAAGLRSTESAHKQLRALAADGYIERGEAPPRQRRPVRLTEKGWGALGTGRFVGTIAAGRGLEPVPEEEAYPLAAELLRSPSGKERFLFRVVGESMREAGIGPGDLLVVEANPSPPDGSIVAATVLDGPLEEATVKVLRRRGGEVVLEPRNGNGEHRSIIVDAKSVLVHGTVEWFVQRASGTGKG